MVNQDLVELMHKKRACQTKLMEKIDNMIHTSTLVVKGDIPPDKYSGCENELQDMMEIEEEIKKFISDKGLRELYWNLAKSIREEDFDMSEKIKKDIENYIL